MAATDKKAIRLLPEEMVATAVVAATVATSRATVAMAAMAATADLPCSLVASVAMAEPEARRWAQDLPARMASVGVAANVRPSPGRVELL
jgi:hypothetical protein